MEKFINVKNKFLITEYTYFLTTDGISKAKDLKDNDIIIGIIGSSQKETENTDEKDTQITWDRIRDVHYNGNELMMNTFECTNCKTIYRFEHIHHDFCPFCGSLYKFKIDISI